MRMLFRSIYFLVASLIVVSYSYAGDIKVNSKISDVTIYPGSARVTRVADFEIPKGEQTIIFENIIPNFDQNSLSVSGVGTAEVKIFGAQIKKVFLKEAANEHIKKLEQNLTEINDAINQQNDLMSVINNSEEFLRSVKLFSEKQLPVDLVTKMPSNEDLNSTFTFLVDKHSSVQKQKQDIGLKKRDLQKEKDVIINELNQLRSGNNKQQQIVVVDVDCLKAGKMKLLISYLVNGANWRPVYDARVKYEEGEVELTAFASIRQTTGEDWEDVRLSISTAKPSLGGRMPFVEPWVIQANVPVNTKARMFSTVQGRLKDDIQEQYEPYYLETDGGAVDKELKAEVSYAQVELKGISVSYNINRLASVKSDGQESKYPISTQKLKANFEYSAYPRLSEYVYLNSVVDNSDELQMLSGEVNLFLEGDFIGKSSIDNVGPGEQFNLYLGVDENVKVKREEILRKMDDVLIAGIPSPNKKVTVENKIKVENYKAKKIKFNLFEAIPVSENDRIKVKTINMSLEPLEKDWKDRKGIVRWGFELDKKESKEIFYSYFVEYPKDMNLRGF